MQRIAADRGFRATARDAPGRRRRSAARQDAAAGPRHRRRSPGRSRPHKNRRARIPRAAPNVSARWPRLKAGGLAICRRRPAAARRAARPGGFRHSAADSAAALALFSVNPPVDRQALAGQRPPPAPPDRATGCGPEPLDRQRIAAPTALGIAKLSGPCMFAVTLDARPGEQLGNRPRRSTDRRAGSRPGRGKSARNRRFRRGPPARRCHDHEADAAQPAVPRLAHRKAQRRVRDHGIDRACRRRPAISAPTAAATPVLRGGRRRRRATRRPAFRTTQFCNQRRHVTAPRSKSTRLV